MSLTSEERMVEVREIIIEAKMAEKNPSTLIPATNKEAIHKTKALTTKVNNPNVNRFIGKVNKRRTGFKTMFKSPTTTAANKAVVKLSILKPGTI